MQTLLFDELDSEIIEKDGSPRQMNQCDLFIHHKGNRQFYYEWNEIYRKEYENYIMKKGSKSVTDGKAQKGEVEGILEDFLAHRVKAQKENFH